MKTAFERGQEMMFIKISELPKKAQDFAKILCDEVGMCMETFLTAWTVYANLEEGLEITNKLYEPRKEDIDWFEKYGK